VGEGIAVYFTRGFSSLLLNRRANAVGPAGVYTCLIPDAGNVLRILSISVSESQLISIITVT
jgi:hypothetical protein